MERALYGSGFPRRNAEKLCEDGRVVRRKKEYLSAVKDPVSKEVADSYAKRIEAILEKMSAKIGCSVDSFEVRELVGEYGFVMKQFSQMKDERGMMLSAAHSYQDAMIKSKIDEKYGEGAADFFTEAIEAFYKN